jgi:hypothetical protein
MKVFTKIGLLFLTLSLTSCAKVFYSPDAQKLASREKVIAIAPPRVSIAARKNVDAESLKIQQETESINFQNEMYTWLLQRQMKGVISQDIQEVEVSQSKLNAANPTGKVLTNQEICDILGVDGIITSSYALSKPMSEGAAIATAVLVGFWGSTNTVAVTANTYNCSNKKITMSFDHKIEGSLGSNTSSMVDNLMRTFSRKMPHAKKK